MAKKITLEPHGPFPPALRALLRREWDETIGTWRGLAQMLVFTGVVAGAVWLVWPRELKLLIHRDRISELIFAILGGSLRFMVLLLGPAEAALSVTRDRDRGSLELFSTTPLSAAQVFQAKFLARAFYLWLMILATLPVASVTYLLGGVPGWRLGLFYFELCLWAAAIVALGVACSARSRNSSSALALAYGIALPLGVAWIAAPGLHIFWIAIPLIGLSILMRDPETQRRLRHPLDPGPAEFWEGTEGAEGEVWGALRRFIIPRRGERPMRDRINPVLMRELRYEGLSGAAMLHRLIPVTIVLGFIGGGVAAYRGGGAGLFFLLLHGIALLLTPAAAAPSLAREFDLGTADALRISLLRPFGIVWPKAALGVYVALVPLALTLLFGLPGVLWKPPPGGAELGLCLFMLAATLALCSATGVFCSLIGASGSQAMLSAYGILGAVFAGAPGLCLLLRVFSDFDPGSYSWIGLGSPATALLAWANQGSAPNSWGGLLRDLYTSNGRLWTDAGWTYAGLALLTATGLFGATVLGLPYVWRRRSQG